MVSALEWLLVATLMLVSVGCNDVVLPWQLDHDRVIAVRATPPHIPADGRSSLDVLVTTVADGPEVVTPMMAALVPGEVAIPVSVVAEDGGFAVVAPDADAIAAARVALDLPADSPVPIKVAVTVEVAGNQLAALKTVYLGDERDNPVLGDVMLGDEPARDGVVVPIAVDVDLSVAADETDDVDWLTSFGDLTDFTDLVATFRAEEPDDGQVTVVVRDQQGGVVWGTWNVSATE